MADTDAVAPEGAAGPSWRASGLPFLSPRRVPGETLGSSVVIVAFLLGGVDWYRCFGALELGGRSSVGAVVVKLLRFRRSAVVGILFSCCFSFVSFGCDCAASASAPILGCIGWLLWNTKRGKTLFRQSQYAAKLQVYITLKVGNNTNKIDEELIIEIVTCKSKEQLPTSQTLNALWAILLHEPTSHIPMSPTFVPTVLQQNIKYIICTNIVKIQEPSKVFEACT